MLEKAVLQQLRTEGRIRVHVKSDAVDRTPNLTVVFVERALRDIATSVGEIRWMLRKQKESMSQGEEVLISFTFDTRPFQDVLSDPGALGKIGELLGTLVRAEAFRIRGNTRFRLDSGSVCFEISFTAEA